MGHQLWHTCKMQRAHLELRIGVEVYIFPFERDWCDTIHILQDCPNYHTMPGQKALISPTEPEPLRGEYKEFFAPFLISIGGKPRGANPHSCKRCIVWEIVMEQTRKIWHNLLTLHPVPENIWTTRITLGSLLSVLMWPCDLHIPGCAGSQLQHLPSTLPDGCWSCHSAVKFEFRA